MRKAAPLVLAVILAASTAQPAIAAAGQGAFRPEPATVPVRELPAGGFAFDHARRLRSQAASERFDGSAVVPMSVEEWAVYPWRGQYRLDGFVSHADAAALTGVLVTVEYQDAHGQVLGTDHCTVSSALVPAMRWSAFSMRYDAPPGTTRLDISAVGEQTTETLAYADSVWSSTGLSPTNERYWSFTLRNQRPYTIVAVGVEVIEFYQPLGGTLEFADAMVPLEPYQQRLAPGESVNVTLWGLNPAVDTAPGGYATSGALNGVAAPPAQEVHRFVTRRTGTHFYTVDVSERDRLVAEYGRLYSYEGVAFLAYAAEELNTRPVYRFFNRQSGTHFYTADPGERDELIASSSVLAYEGVGLWVCDSGGLATSAAYRFYNTRAGVHFYTIDPTERDSIVAGLGHIYRLEGEAFNVPKP